VVDDSRVTQGRQIQGPQLEAKRGGLKPQQALDGQEVGIGAAEQHHLGGGLLDERG
jgi:hypothetical protein